MPGLDGSIGFLATIIPGEVAVADTDGTGVLVVDALSELSIGGGSVKGATVQGGTGWRRPSPPLSSLTRWLPMSPSLTRPWLTVGVE